MSHYTILQFISSKSFKETKEKVLNKLNLISLEKCRSITYDNGSEMLHNGLYKEIQNQKSIKVYFANPGCPHQRGLNENTNGLIRQYLPKGVNFKKIKNLEQFIQDIEIKYSIIAQENACNLKHLMKYFTT
jgi:IS30 family transposase